MKKILILSLVLAVAASVAGCSPSSSDPDTSSVTSGLTSPAEVTPPPSAAEGTGGIRTTGEAIEQEGFLVTLTDVSESAGGVLSPAEGKVFLYCSFDIENRTAEDVTVSTALSFDCYIDGTKVPLSVTALASRKEGRQLDGKVEAGKMISGFVAYEVDKEWNSLQIDFKPNIAGSNKLSFTANHE